MEFEISLDKDDIKEVREFIESDSFADLMNRKGLGFPAMAFVMQKLFNACDEAETILEGGDKD